MELVIDERKSYLVESGLAEHAFPPRLFCLHDNREDGMVCVKVNGATGIALFSNKDAALVFERKTRALRESTEREPQEIGLPDALSLLESEQRHKAIHLMDGNGQTAINSLYIR